MPTALLVIDMQKAFHHNFSKTSMNLAAVTINRAITICRQRNLPVVWIQDEGGGQPESESFQMIDALHPLDDELKVTKRYLNSFNKTPLLTYLMERDVDTVIVSGYNAVYCVLSTYRGALDHDLHPILLKHAIASNAVENIKFVKKLCKNMIDVDSL